MSSSQTPGELIRSGCPIRILAVAYPKSPLFANTEAVEGKVLEELQIEKQHTNHVASELWPRLTTMVFDYRHDEYDFENAHNCEQLRTITVLFITAQRVQIRVAEGASRERINKEVAELHRMNGSRKTPFFADRRNNQVPDYPNPRDMAQT